MSPPGPLRSWLRLPPTWSKALLFDFCLQRLQPCPGRRGLPPDKERVPGTWKRGKRNESWGKASPPGTLHGGARLVRCCRNNAPAGLDLSKHTDAPVQSKQLPALPGARHWSKGICWPPSPPTRQCREPHVAVEEAEAHGAQGACPGRSPGQPQSQGWFPPWHTPPESTVLCPQYGCGASPATGINENPRTLGNSSKKREKNQDNMPQPSPCPTPLLGIHPKNQSGGENRH